MTDAHGTTADAVRWDPDALGVILAPFEGTAVPDWLLAPMRAGLAGVVLFGYNTPDPQTAGSLARALHGESPSLLVAIDEEGGDVTRLQAAQGSGLPTAWTFGEVDDPDLTRRAGEALGAVLAACDIDLDLAPVVDVSTDPRNPVIGTRAYGDDPDLVARHVRAMSDGLRSRGVGSCGKHFPGHGATTADSHTSLPLIDLDEGDFRAEHLAPWEIAPWLDAVMTAHVLVPALGEGPASISPWARQLLDEVSGSSGYRGLLITDALDMAAVAADSGFGEAAVRAIESGADLLCLGTSLRRDDEAMLREAHDAIVAAVKSGRLPREELAARARRAHEQIAAIRTRRSFGAAPSLEDALGALAQIGATAASRGVEARGVRLDPSRGVAVVDARSRRDHASNTKGSVLVELLRGAGLDAWEAGDADPASLGEDRQVLILTRLPQADPAERERVDAVLAARPEAICVHVGVPDAARRADRFVHAHGASRANLAAAVAAMLPGRRGR